MVLLLLTGCAGFHFTVSQEGSTLVEGSGLLGELLGSLDFGGLDDFDVSVEQKLADQGVEPGDLTGLNLTAIEMRSPDGSLDFIDTLQVKVGAKGIAPFLVAFGSDFSGSTGSLTLEEVDLVESIVAGGVYFQVDATGEPPAEDTTIKLRVDAEGWASAQGAASQL